MTWRQWVWLEGIYKPSYLHCVHCCVLKISKIKDNKNTNGNNKIQTPNAQSTRRNTPGQTHGSMLDVGSSSYHKVNLERVWDSRSIRWPDHDTLWPARHLKCPEALGPIRNREPEDFQGFCEPEGTALFLLTGISHTDGLQGDGLTIPPAPHKNSHFKLRPHSGATQRSAGLWPQFVLWCFGNAVHMVSNRTHWSKTL